MYSHLTEFMKRREQAFLYMTPGQLFALVAGTAGGYMLLKGILPGWMALLLALPLGVSCLILATPWHNIPIYARLAGLLTYLYYSLTIPRTISAAELYQKTSLSTRSVKMYDAEGRPVVVQHIRQEER